MFRACDTCLFFATAVSCAEFVTEHGIVSILPVAAAWTVTFRGTCVLHSMSQNILRTQAHFQLRSAQEHHAFDSPVSCEATKASTEREAVSLRALLRVFTALNMSQRLRTRAHFTWLSSQEDALVALHLT